MGKDAGIRQRLADFYEARQPLLDLKTKANAPCSNPWGTLIGGYSQTFNIFEAAIAFDVPLDFELRPQQVFDSVNQTV